MLCRGAYSLPSVLNRLIQRLDPSPKPIKVGSAVEPAVSDDGADLPGVSDVRQRVRIEEDEISQLPRLDSPQRVRHAQHSRGVNGGGPQGFQRSEPGLDQQCQLLVQADSGDQHRDTDIRRRQQDDARFVQQAGVLYLQVNEGGED